MATIGTFTKSGDLFTGAIKTLSISAKATIKAADKVAVTMNFGPLVLTNFGPPPG